MRELIQLIKAATPASAAIRGVNRDVVSEGREQLRYVLAQRSAEFAIVVEAPQGDPEIARILNDIDERHGVDTEWLAAQKIELAALESEVALG